MSKGASALLSKHPLITSVTPQRRVTRTLTSVTNDESEHDVTDEEHLEEEQRLEEDEEMEKWTRGRRSLAFGELLILNYSFYNKSYLIVKKVKISQSLFRSGILLWILFVNKKLSSWIFFVDSVYLLVNISSTVLLNNQYFFRNCILAIDRSSRRTSTFESSSASNNVDASGRRSLADGRHRGRC